VTNEKGAGTRPALEKSGDWRNKFTFQQDVDLCDSCLIFIEPEYSRPYDEIYTMEHFLWSKPPHLLRAGEGAFIL
jgi:hypothetical protein